MNKELSEVIMNKSCPKNRHLEWPSRKNFLGYKKGKGKCNNSLPRKTKRKYFANVGKTESSQTSRLFWNLVKHFITKKGAISNEKIVIKPEENGITKIKDKHDTVSIKVNDLINDGKVLAKMFNNHYINIVQRTVSLVPKILGNSI